MNWNELAQRTKLDRLESGAIIQSQYPDFSVWSWGTGRYSEVLGGVRSGFDRGEVLLADYEYEHSRQMHAPTATGMLRGLTICIVKSSSLSLPYIFLRNEAPIQKMYKRALGKHDIYFASDPEFSDHFEVQGPEAEVHAIFRPEVRKYFLDNFKTSPLRLETHGDTIMIHYGVMINPEDSRMLLLSAVEIANLWAAQPVNFEIPSVYFFQPSN